MTTEINIKGDEAIEDLLYGRMKIIQKKEGYRFSIDALLLANFVRVKKHDNVIDLGTGSGIIPLVLSNINPSANITGIEIDDDVADMAKRSVELNGLLKEISILEGDVRKIRDILPPESFDVAVANPPYGRLDTGRLNPAAEKASARHEISGSLDDFLKSASYLLKYRGRAAIIYPARRTADVIYGMRENGMEPKRMRMVHSREGESAKLILVEGVKGGGVEMEVERPLYIYDEKGAYTE